MSSPLSSCACYTLIRHEGNADAINCSANQGLHVINDERAAHGNRQGFLPLSNSHR